MLSDCTNVSSGDAKLLVARQINKSEVGTMKSEVRGPKVPAFYQRFDDGGYFRLLTSDLNFLSICQTFFPAAAARNKFVKMLTSERKSKAGSKLYGS